MDASNPTGPHSPKIVLMRILNLGCGAKTSSHPSGVNIDWSILLRMRSNPIMRTLAPALLNGYRLERFNALPSNILVHDLSRGIPFDDSSVDVVYHSHMLEHLDRDVAELFIAESRRVLRVGGVHRVVVPDFERYARAYLTHLDACSEDGEGEIARHDVFLEPLLLQSVRREASGTSRQRTLRRFVENLLLGDARRRGETHQWMYDRFNLQALLERHGFCNVRVRSYDTSSVPEWDGLGLDSDNTHKEYKPESLYIEASAC